MSLKYSVSEVDVGTAGELFGKPRRLEQGHFSDVVELPIFLTFSIFLNMCLANLCQGLTSLDPEVAQLVHRTGAGLPNQPIFSSTRLVFETSKKNAN